jgi:chaperone modulatory protein CbpM
MISLDILVVTVDGLDRGEVEHWIAQEWVRPHQGPEGWLFRDIDVARLRLIRELRYDLALDETALPMVLHLLDQLYATRRHLRRLTNAVDRHAPAEIRDAVVRALGNEVRGMGSK